ncbi:unnamed protein product [Nesidiocoris tenuis]|uniref:Uncharacterized protein n=1 Tax=Nesidiocoris tenuis TaxID=355587 RepID=A0A6H5GCV6_9HEMI|nr:unnamed protein product [Nesidiocoris tenuis]
MFLSQNLKIRGKKSRIASSKSWMFRKIPEISQHSLPAEPFTIPTPISFKRGSKLSQSECHSGACRPKNDGVNEPTRNVKHTHNMTITFKTCPVTTCMVHTGMPIRDRILTAGHALTRCSNHRIRSTNLLGRSCELSHSSDTALGKCQNFREESAGGASKVNFNRSTVTNKTQRAFRTQPDQVGASCEKRYTGESS